MTNKQLDSNIKIANHLTYDYTDHLGEKNKKPSLTVPGQAMSVLEIMQRWAKGIPVENLTRVAEYYEEEMPNLAKMDLSEKYEYMKQNAQLIKDLTEQVQEQQKVWQSAEKKRKLTELEAQLAELKALEGETLPKPKKQSKNENNE